MSDKLTLVVPKAVIKAAKGKALDEDISLSNVVRGLLAGWLAGDIPTPPKDDEGE